MFKILAVLVGVLGSGSLCAFELTHAATLANLQGSASQVEIVTQDGMRQVPSIGTRLSNGTRIKTNANVLAQILFDDGSQMLIGPNTDVLLNSSQPRDVDINLKQGRIRSKVAKQPPTFNLPPPNEKPKYRIHVGSITLGVSGTDFIVGANQAHDKVVVETAEGIVDLWKSSSVNFATPDRRLKPGDGVEVKFGTQERPFRVSLKNYGNLSDRPATGSGDDLSGNPLIDLWDSFVSYVKGLWAKLTAGLD